MSYSDILRKAWQNISFGDVGILDLRVRKAMNASVLLEISGAGRKNKADRLAERLGNVLGDRGSHQSSVQDWGNSDHRPR